MAFQIECKKCGTVYLAGQDHACKPKAKVKSTKKLDAIDSLPRTPQEKIEDRTAAIKAAFDRRAYQKNYMKEYMRKRRAKDREST